VRDGAALWWCASCQDRDAVTAAVRAAGGDGWTPPPCQAPARPPKDPAEARRAALALWESSAPIAGTLAETYLAARGLAGEQSTALRFHPAVRHVNPHVTCPALVALIVSTETGKPVAVHRTYLRRDGTGKADLDPPRACKGPMAGAAIMLHAPEAGAALIVAEGIETALSAGRMMGAPAWAAISAGNLRRITPPAEPNNIIIAADPDPVGQREAWAAARLWRAAGRLVRVATPDTAGQDFNALLCARMAREVAHG
jgi:putative DNA primase/helicase